MPILLKTEIERTAKTPVTARRARVGGLCRFRHTAERVPIQQQKTGRCADVRHKNSTEAQRSGFGLERRSSEMSELSALAGSEGYGACDDEGAYRFRRGHGSGNSGRWRLATLKRAFFIN